MTTTGHTTHEESAIFLTAGGRIQCLQCTAKSKRSGLRCRAVAMKTSTGQKCKVHGGKSTGAKTQDGRARIAEANTVHGRETRTVRAERKLALERLAALELLARSLGMFGATPPK